MRRDLPDLDAVECYGAAGWRGNLTGHGARSVLGIEASIEVASLPSSLTQ